MKLAVFIWHGTTRAGIVDEAEGMVACVDAPPEAIARDGVAAFVDAPMRATGEVVRLSEIGLLAPIPCPRRNIFCVGKNYHEHAREFSASGFDSSAGAVPDAPIVFSKLPQSVIGPGQPIVIDRTVSQAVDYEAELAVIIGRPGRNVAPENAMGHVWGYTIVNDVTARDLQGRHSQWLIGKSQDTFCPMGPWAATADTVDLTSATIKCWVNDDLRQDPRTALLIFDIPTLIAAISNGITLMAGDVIATGTPAGVGIGFKPPRYLQSGDRVRIEIAGIGTLTNPVEAR